MPTTYANQTVWREMQQFLPPEFQWRKGRQPEEKWWNWNGHRIHFDTYRNPQARVKVNITKTEDDKVYFLHM